MGTSGSQDRPRPRTAQTTNADQAGENSGIWMKRSEFFIETSGPFGPRPHMENASEVSDGDKFFLKYTNGVDELSECRTELEKHGSCIIAVEKLEINFDFGEYSAQTYKQLEELMGPSQLNIFNGRKIKYKETGEHII